MPIANCFIKNHTISEQQLAVIVERWANEIEVDVKDICLTVVKDFIQAGQQYDVMVNLLLPSLWSKESVEKIQLCLFKSLRHHFKVQPSAIFITTTIVQSGHVVENGKIVSW